MRTFRPNLGRFLLIALVLLLAVGLIAPYLHADMFAQSARAALSEALGRPVEVGEVRFNLFHGPGFSLRNVIIPEDSSAGIEPFAYVSSLETRIALRSLWTGHLRFSSLRLDEPSVNLVKTASGLWNFQILFGRESKTELPEIHVRGGRLNFKFGDLKSVYYFSRADLDITPPSSPGGSWDLHFSGEPARTDRAYLALGKLEGRGRWRTPHGSEQRLVLDLTLDRSAVSELVTLIHGHDLGVHGFVTAQARLQGPASNLEISGTLQLEDIHRWDLMPPYAQAGILRYRGQLNLIAQNLEVETVADPNSALTARFLVLEYLRNPRWSLTLQLNRMAPAPALDVARHLGAPIPQNLNIEGELTGEITYSPEDGFRGHLSLEEAVATLAQYPAARFARVELTIEGGRATLLSQMYPGENQKPIQLTVDYSLSTRQLDLKIETPGTEIPAAKDSLPSLLGMVSAPFLSAFVGGSWSGWLAYTSEPDNPGKWMGRIQLLDTETRLPVFSVPLRIHSAKVVFDGLQVAMNKLEGSLGDLDFKGEYYYQPTSRRPVQWRCTTGDLDVYQLEKVLMPVLARKRGFFLRTLGIHRSTLPAWLQNWRSEGQLAADTLSLPGVKLEAVKASVVWERADLQATEITGKLAGGEVCAGLSVNLRGSEPFYGAAVRIRSANWRGGKVDLEGAVRTNGIGGDVLQNLQAEGIWNGYAIYFIPGLRLRTVSGDFAFSFFGSQPRLSLLTLRAVTPDGIFYGQGGTQPDGRLRIELKGDQEQIHLSGTILPLELQVEETR